MPGGVSFWCPGESPQKRNPDRPSISRSAPRSRPAGCRRHAPGNGPLMRRNPDGGWLGPERTRPRGWPARGLGRSRRPGDWTRANEARAGGPAAVLGLVKCQDTGFGPGREGFKRAGGDDAFALDPRRARRRSCRPSGPAWATALDARCGPYLPAAPTSAPLGDRPAL